MTKKQLNEFLAPHMDKKVSVTYADGKGAHETTVKQLTQKWFGETLSWKEWWFSQLINNGVANSIFGGTYTMQSEARELSDKEDQQFQAFMDNLPDSKEMTRVTE